MRARFDMSMASRVTASGNMVTLTKCANACVALQVTLSGSVTVDGVPLTKEVRRKIGFVLQVGGGAG